MQERFVACLMAIIIIDMFVFSMMQNWSGPIAITVLELLLMIVAGRMCGVEDISQLVTSILRHAGNKVAGTKD